MRFIILLIIKLLHLSAISQGVQPTTNSGTLAKDPRVNWLKKNALSLRSVNPHDDDFADMQPLKKLIGNSRVVLLGEQTHQDGTTDSARIRLIEFLHQEMKFDVLAFESGFYDVTRAWQDVKKGKSVYSALRSSVYFTTKDAYKPLIDYLEQTYRTPSPMEVIGVDSHLTGTPGGDSLNHDLKRFFSGLGLETTHFDDTAVFAKQLKSIGSYGGNKVPDHEFYLMLARMDLGLSRLNLDTLDPQAKFYAQVFKSVRKCAERNLMRKTSTVISGVDQHRAAFFNLNIRDAQMADNLLWYLKQYPERKVIVWAHNYHIATADIAKDDPLKYKPESMAWRDSTGMFAMRPMGQYVREALGDAVYSIVFTAYSGERGNIKNGVGKTTPIVEDQRPEAEFEELMNAAGANYAFVDLRQPTAGGEWLKKRLTARPMDNQALEGEWYKAADAFFFMRRMYPSTYTY